MERIFLIFAASFLWHSCMPNAQNKTLTYQNIIILSDLSDRIEPMINGTIPNQQYPPKDVSEIDKILDFFRNEQVRPGEKIGDRSSIFFSTFSDEIVTNIDIGKIKDLKDKQQFINSTGKYEGKGLDYEIGVFKQKVQTAYNNIQDEGLDLISILINKINDDSIIKPNIVLTNGVDATTINYDNHIYIFTDGYLEYYGKQINNQFYFGPDDIDKVRKYCKTHKIDIKTALENNPSFHLPPIKNDNNQFIQLHILETHERDKNIKLQTYRNPAGLRDNEILEAVWRKWATASGFKDFEWRKY